MIERLADEQFRHLGVALQRREVVYRQRRTIATRRFATRVTKRFATKITKERTVGFFFVSFVSFVADGCFVCFVAGVFVATGRRSDGLPVVGRCIRARRTRPSETADHGQRRAQFVFLARTRRGERPQRLGKVARCRCLPAGQGRGMRLERRRYGLTTHGPLDNLGARETIERVIDLGEGALKGHGYTWSVREKSAGARKT